MEIKTDNLGLLKTSLAAKIPYSRFPPPTGTLITFTLKTNESELALTEDRLLLKPYRSIFIMAKMSIASDILLTDICGQANKKIYYSRHRGSEDNSVLINSCNITQWNCWKSLSWAIKGLFLPQGYPNSVSSDYLEYQTWDTLQAFCSSISGTLAMSAVMRGIGVGSDAATPISAAITWLLKDGTGMAGSILFAWFKGTSFDTESKKWRLFADFLNDLAMFVELLIPYVMNYSMCMLLIATSLKSLVRIAGSSTRIAFINHQAIRGNTADISAKDGSQEILINLCAFIFGIFILKYVTETSHIWTVMCISALFHLTFNYKAVRCLKMNVFNTERFCICVRAYFPTSSVPTIEQVNSWESIFFIKTISDVKICNFSIVLGASLEKAFTSQDVGASEFSAILALFLDKPYFIMVDLKNKTLYITFRESYKETDVLKSYFHAFLMGISLSLLQKEKHLSVVSRSRKNSPIYRLRNVLKEFLTVVPESSSTNQESKILFQAYNICEGLVDKEYQAFQVACSERGWLLNKHLLKIGEWRAEWGHKAESVQPSRRARPKTQKVRKRGFQKEINEYLLR